MSPFWSRTGGFGPCHLYQRERWVTPDGQVQRLLTDKQADFVSEAQAVLGRAGASPFVSADDTGARRTAGKNGFCTQIGNDWFTWFGTRSSKSRLNFLDLLRAGHTDYVLNDAAYGYMRKHVIVRRR